MRDLSRAADPQAMYRVYARGMGEVLPTSRQISLSRRGLGPPKVRVTRFNLWPQPVNPWTDADKLPVLEGGLFGELAHAGRPRVIEELAVPPDDPAAEYLAGQGSLLALPLFD